MTTFRMPVTFEGGRLVTCEPGDPEHLQARVVTTLRTELGDRLATPEFGTVLPVFDESTIDVADVLLAQVNQFVPDAEAGDIEAAVRRVGG